MERVGQDSTMITLEGRQFCIINNEGDVGDFFLAVYGDPAFRRGPRFRETSIKRLRKRLPRNDFVQTDRRPTAAMLARVQVGAKLAGSYVRSMRIGHIVPGFIQTRLLAQKPRTRTFAFLVCLWIP